MFATITWASGRGFWFAETDGTCQSVFIHINKVKDRRVLRLNDRVRLDVVPSTKKPGEFEGLNVEWIGICIARQTGAPASSEMRR